MENLTYSDEVSVWDWVVTLLVTSIPVVGFIMLFVWAFNANTNPSKANFAKATLLLFAIFIGLYLIAAFALGSFTLFFASGNTW